MRPYEVQPEIQTNILKELKMKSCGSINNVVPSEFEYLNNDIANVEKFISISNTLNTESKNDNYMSLISESSISNQENSDKYIDRPNEIKNIIYPDMVKNRVI